MPFVLISWRLSAPWLSLCYLFFILNERLSLAKTQAKLYCYYTRTWFCLKSLFFPNWNNKLKISPNSSVLKTYFSNHLTSLWIYILYSFISKESTFRIPWIQCRNNNINQTWCWSLQWYDGVQRTLSVTWHQNHLELWTQVPETLLSHWMTSRVQFTVLVEYYFPIITWLF